MTPSIGNGASSRQRYDWVVAQLATYSGKQKRIDANSIFVQCPVHNENTPSGRIFYSPTSRSPGYFKCYGCGAKMNWDELAPKIGLKPFAWQKPSVQFAHKVMTHVAETQSADAELSYSSLPENKSWRSIPTNLLIALGGKICTNSWSPERFVFLPVLVRKELKGYIRARLRKLDDQPSYLNSKGKWSENFGLFPYDYAVQVMKEKNLSVLVLVEGPRDALRLLNLGIPAIAILGTQSWSPRKSRNLELSGAQHLILMMDGDDAGLKAEGLILPSLKSMFTTHLFSLRGEDSPYAEFEHLDSPSKVAKVAGVSLWDPGNCPHSKIQQLQKLIRRISRSEV